MIAENSSDRYALENIKMKETLVGKVISNKVDNKLEEIKE
jgi:hypothetical protein